MKILVDGVNRLLNSIGEPALLEAEDVSESEEARLAEQQIKVTMDNILSKGYKFNTIKGVKLLPDTNGYISKPPNALDVIFNNDALVFDDGVVFDRVEFTKFFEEGVTATLITRESFEFIPTVIQEYILATSSYIFQRDKINDSNMNAELKSELFEAKKEAIIYRIRQVKANGLNDKFDRTRNP